MQRKLLIKVAKYPAVVIARPAIRENKLVYLACANKLIRYQRGRSRIVYIGTTRRGVRRITGSAAQHASTLLKKRGIRFLEFFVVTCTARGGMRGWQKLERALIVTFKDVHGELPLGNRQGKNIWWRDEWRYFSRKRLFRVIEDHCKK